MNGYQEGVIEIVNMHKSDKNIGKRFGMLTVLSTSGHAGRSRLYNVKCDCGNEKTVRANNLYSQKSCGCMVGQKGKVVPGIPSELKDKKSELMCNGKLLVFENGDIFRSKGDLFYECKKSVVSRGGKYQTVSYTEGGKQIHKYVHRLVAEAFLPNPENKEQVNHIDNDGHNNNVRNLEWTTDKENKAHARNLLGNYTMNNSKICIFCESVATISALQVCESCSLKVKKFKRREEKIAKLNDAYSSIDRDLLTDREKTIVSLTMKGQTLEEIAKTHKISPQRVSKILQSLRKKSL